MDPSDASILEISALSRPLDLGTLYDARTDQLIPGISLWKPDDIKAKTRPIPQPNTRFQVAVSESLSEKTSLLDVSTSVEASFLCGLVEVGGSAEYLTETTSSTHQCRVSLNYQKTTEVRELIVTELGDPNAEVLSNTDATHVVTQVLYGADAIMEFEEVTSDASSKEEVQVNLHTMINMLPLITINADGSLDMTDEDKEKVQNFSCKFYGDFELKELPFTFEEAVKVYKELPSLVGENGEKGVPVKVWLYPLSKLDSAESKLKRMISETLVSALEKAMDDLHLAEIRTNDLLEKSKQIKAEDITIKLEKFQSCQRDFVVEFLQKLSDLVPAIRGGDMEESALRELLQSKDECSFSGNEMEQWLDGKDTEINVVMMYINKLQFDIKHPGPELDTFLMDPDVTDAFVFSFTSLKYEEPYLDKISQTTKSFKSGSTVKQPEQIPSEEIPWYKRSETKMALDSSASFISKALFENKVISFISDAEHLGASVLWYNNAALKANACYLTLDPNTACRHLLLSEGNKKVSWVEEEQQYPDHPDRFDDDIPQVLSKETLNGRCYWEWDIDVLGTLGEFCVGVAYKSIGQNEDIRYSAKAWILKSYFCQLSVMHDGIETPLLASFSFRVGVCMDLDAGTLSFYSVSSDSLTHLHTFNITYTDEPLYAVVKVLLTDSSMSLV